MNQSSALVLRHTIGASGLVAGFAGIAIGGVGVILGRRRADGLEQSQD